MASKKEDACKYEFTTAKMCLQLAIIHSGYYGRMTIIGVKTTRSSGQAIHRVDLERYIIFCFCIMNIYN